MRILLKDGLVLGQVSGLDQIVHVDEQVRKIGHKRARVVNECGVLKREKFTLF